MKLSIVTDGYVKKIGSKTVYPGSETYDNWKYGQDSSWISHKNEKDEYVTLQVEVPTLIYGVAMKGRSDCEQWIKKYSIKVSKNGIDWINMGSFKGCDDNVSTSYVYFDDPIYLNSIKFTDFETDNHMCARFGLLVKE
jgi:hypothetical protein